MSADIDYFFNSDKSFEQLVKEFDSCLGSSFGTSEKLKEHSYSEFFGLAFDFYVHSLENDGTVNFEDYKYYIGSIARPDLKDTRLSVTALIINILYYRMNISQGILVYNVQSILAEYEERIISENTKGLFDKISGRFVEFPQHFVDLDNLLCQ